MIRCFSHLFLSSSQGGGGTRRSVLAASSSFSRMASTLLQLLLLSALLVSFSSSSAWMRVSSQASDEPGSVTIDGPLLASQCTTVNPNPNAITSCTSLPQPTSNLLALLPWSSGDYKACVVARCQCTGAADTTAAGYEPNGIYCLAGDEFQESGYTTCDSMMSCFSTFWECTAAVAWSHYLSGATLESSEQNYINAILEEGKSFGGSFSNTEVYKSCALIQCEAAAGRKNCGLLTCIPNNTQCVNVLNSPPAPNGENTCSEACQAVLVIMAITVGMIVWTATCFVACPPRVRMIKPVVATAPSDVSSYASSSAIISDDDNEGPNPSSIRKPSEPAR